MDRLKDKRVIVYGDERYILDFLYVFDHISVQYYVDDCGSEFAAQYTRLRDENKEEVFVIICKYEELQAERNLQSLGFEKNKQYASASSFFYELDFPIKRIAREKKVFVWGTGDNAADFFTQYVEKNPEIEILGCVDSNADKKGKRFFRKKVYSPEDVLGEKDAFFIIASKKYYLEIKAKLIKNGYKDRTDFISYLEINNYASWMMNETVYDTPRLDYVCYKPFKVAELKPEGRLLICGGMPGLMQKTVPYYYSDFDSIWHSNILKIVRLSTVNGTYSFCNPRNCCYLEHSGNCEIDVNEIRYTTGYSKEQLDYIKKYNQNPQKVIFNRENYKRSEDMYPGTIQCGWDESCNLHCPSCREGIYIADLEKKKELKAFSERVKKELFMPYAKRIKVAGLGEAFASEIYKEIIFDREIAKRVQNIGILSNGSLFTPERFDELAGIWLGINVFISMDGSKKETAESLRAGINFEKWKENMRYLGKMKQGGRIQSFAFNFVVQRENYREMPSFARMCLEEFHADKIKFSKVFNWGYYTDEEFQNITMFDHNNEMKSELQEVVRDEIFKRPEIYLFRWIDW